jgi:prophage maintenance system killer protein
VESINIQSGVYAKASWALYMSRLNSFFDGHKRTCFTLAAIILKVNGHWLGRSDEDELFDVLHKISDATIKCDVSRIERWLKRKSCKWWKTEQKPITDYL